MVQQSRRPAVAEEIATTLEAAPEALEPGNQELLALLGLAPERDEEQERPWLDGPEFGSGAMLAAMRAPMPLPLAGEI